MTILYKMPIKCQFPVLCLKLWAETHRLSPKLEEKKKKQNKKTSLDSLGGGWLWSISFISSRLSFWGTLLLCRLHSLGAGRKVPARSLHCRVAWNDQTWPLCLRINFLDLVSLTVPPIHPTASLPLAMQCMPSPYLTSFCHFKVTWLEPKERPLVGNDT